MKVTAAGWQVTLCDPMWHVISRIGVVISITNCYIRVYFTLLLYEHGADRGRTKICACDDVSVRTISPRIAESVS